MRQLKAPDDSDRVETGAICFGDDWPGLFIRGDDAIRLSWLLQRALDGEIDDFSRQLLQSFISIIDDEVHQVIHAVADKKGDEAKIHDDGC